MKKMLNVKVKLNFFRSLILSVILAAGILTVQNSEVMAVENEILATVGDVNGDNQISAMDVTALRRYLAGGWNVTINENDSDIYDDELRSRTEYTYKDDILIYNKTYFHMENTTNETEITYDENGEIVNQYKKENVSGNITVDEIYFEGSNKIRKISELSEQSDGNETLKSVKTRIYYEEDYSIERENILYSVLAEYTLDSHVCFDSTGKNHKRHDVYTYPDGTVYDIYFVYDGEWVMTDDYEYFSQY